MSFSAYDAFEDPYTYPGSTVLRNKLDIRDQATLNAFEVEVSTARVNELFPLGNFDSIQYRKLHRHIFQDVYEWAGEYRTVRTSKGGNAFCYPEYIPREMDRILGDFPSVANLRKMEKEAFLRSLALLLSDLNAVHPFREGNGRSQLVFLSAITSAAGRRLSPDLLDRQSYLTAIIESFSGRLNLLVEELRKILA